MLSIHMTEKDISELIARYKAGPDLVRYTDFVAKIDEQFFDYELAKKNLETTKSVSVYLFNINIFSQLTRMKNK